MEFIIAKIDNDFNPDNSDWINRVSAWCKDAMSQLKILSYVVKKRKIPVYDKIVRLECCIVDNDFYVLDKNGCKIKRLDYRLKDVENDNDDNNFSNCDITDTINKTVNENTIGNDFSSFGIHNNDDDVNKQTTVINRRILPVGSCDCRNYVVVSPNKLELNFDTDYVYVINKEVATQHSEYFDEEIPIIPNNGLLIEALAYYCMYKMLCRGAKHPVFNLNASQYGTNPYFMWMNLKDKAKASVINQLQDLDSASDEWRNYFYNSTFPK